LRFAGRGLQVAGRRLQGLRTPRRLKSRATQTKSAEADWGLGLPIVDHVEGQVVRWGGLASGQYNSEALVESGPPRRARRRDPTPIDASTTSWVAKPDHPWPA